MVGDLVRPVRNASEWRPHEAVEAALMAIRLGVDPVEACWAAGIRASDFWHALLTQETYRGDTLNHLTQAQRKALVLAVLKEPSTIE